MIALKATVYRTSDETPLVPALVEASENGKQSVCLVELKARFDERRNIEWSQALERAGVHVVYGFPNLKIHAKATLVVRREAGGLKRYVHIGTGNYHSVTARLYEDFGLFTADPEIAEDVANLFNYVTGFGRPEQFRKLLVAPFNLRDRVIEEIRTVASAAAAKKHAVIRLKVNNLSDPAIIDELYLASQAGAKVDLIIRSVCTLRPGCEGAEREHPRAQRARPLPRAQPRLPLRGPRAAHVLRRQRRSAAAEPRPPPGGGRARWRTPGSSSGSAQRSTRCSRTTRPGSSSPTGRGSATARRRASRRGRAQAVLMRSARRRRRPRRVSLIP